MPVNELSLAVIRHRVDEESASLRRNLENRTTYQPKRRYTVGEELTFPALEFASGRVVEVRDGHNPDAGAFEVISVEMRGGKFREFAAHYTLPHRLNDDSVVLALSEDQEALPAEQLHALYGQRVAGALDAALEKNTEFLRIGEDWFLRALMAEVNVGHLNLAEAVLDLANGGPLPTSIILRDLGLPPEIAGELQEISLNGAMTRDDRFDDVSLGAESSWFLRRLEPQEVRDLPVALRPARFTGPAQISDALKALEVALDDELSSSLDETVLTEAGEPPKSVQVVLTYPHRRSGTLGWSRRLAAILPKIEKPRVPVRFRDRMTNKEFVVWLMREGRYVYGLRDWYEQNDLPPGAYIDIARGQAENEFFIDSRRHRPKREWVRVATNRDGHLRLETAQRGVGCVFDDQLMVFYDDASSLDALRGSQPRDVAQVVREVFPEIAKLSPQGNVHGATLYAVVNVVTRAAPFDVFAALTASGSYQSVGDNYWHLAETRS